MSSFSGQQKFGLFPVSEPMFLAFKNAVREVDLLLASEEVQAQSFYRLRLAMVRTLLAKADSLYFRWRQRALGFLVEYKIHLAKGNPLGVRIQNLIASLEVIREELELLAKEESESERFLKFFIQDDLLHEAIRILQGIHIRSS